MSEFRDAIGQGVLNGMDDWSGEDHWQMFAADAILAMPEMQAIRSALRHAAYNAARHAFPASGRTDPTETYLRENCYLSESAIVWVMSDD